MSRVLLLLLLLRCTLSQDISFPISEPDDPAHDSEYIQVQQAGPEASYMPQAMTDYQPGSFGAGAGASSGFSGASAGPGGGYGGGYGEAGGVAAGVIDLGLAVHRVARNEGSSTWWVYSPTSISTALYMVLLGANGKTYTELSRLLGVNSISSSLKPHEDFSTTLKYLQYTGHQKNIVNIANGLFVQNDFSIRQDYRDITSSLYQTSLQSLDFRFNASYARDVINSWVYNKTMRKISEILPENPPPETKIVLTSSLYFKGEWTNPFPTELTKLQNFYPNGRSQPAKLKIPMMATQGNYLYFQDNFLNCEVVGIPYKGENIIFYLVLPHNSNTDKLKTLETQLSHSELERLFNNTVLTHEVIVAMPKIKLTSEYLLNSALQELGLRSLFDPKEADLSLLSSATGLPRQPPGIFEDEERVIFNRMKKVNVSIEERRRRNINDGFVKSSTGNFEEVQQRRMEEQLGKLGLEKNEEVNFGRAGKIQPASRLQTKSPGIHFKYPPFSTYPELPIFRKKRQIKLDNSPNSQGLLSPGKKDNSLDPSRHLRTLSNPGLYVNQIRHKVIVEINEKGTEAAATTAVSMSKTVSHTVKADTPYMFFIRHESTKMILFWGSIHTPPIDG